MVKFDYTNNRDDEAIDLVFNKKKADDRKNWLSNYDPNVSVDTSKGHLKYTDFINKEFI